MRGVPLVLLLLLGSPVALAETAGRAEAEASCQRGDLAMKELRFADAVAAYHRAVDADPSAACIAGARARAADLEAHAEGGFAPLTALERVRRDPAKMDDAGAVEALAAAVETFPEGRVRVEARVTLAHAYQHHEGDPERAITSYTAAIRDASGDRLTRSLALAELWTLLRQRGAIDRAVLEVERDPELSPSLTKIIRRAHRHEQVGRVAKLVLVAMGAVFAASMRRLAFRSRDVRDLPGTLVRPFFVAFSLYIGGAAALLVRARGEGDARPFLLLGLAVLAIGALARALPMAIGLRSRAARGAWAAACVIGLCAAAFVAVDDVDASYLTGIGL